jgi:hypothetical protein
MYKGSKAAAPAPDRGATAFAELAGADKRSVIRSVLPAFAAGVLSLLVVFRAFITSHFDRILSEPMDGRLNIAILEHWTNVFRGHSNILSPPFYYPIHRALGYSDTLFLYTIPYSLARVIGLDTYVAFEVTMVMLAAIGFTSMYWLIVSILRLNRDIAALGAFLFTISNVSYIETTHVQLAAIAFVPLLFTLIGQYWKNRTVRPRLARVCVVLGACLLATLFLTGFYTGWFTVLSAATVVVFAAAIGAIAEESFDPWRRAFRALRFQVRSVSVGVLALALALIPFLIVYLPVLKQTGARSRAETIHYMNAPAGVLDVGQGNVVWGRLAASIERHLGPENTGEKPAGWPLLSIFVFVVSSLYCIRQLFSRTPCDQAESFRLCVICAAAVSCVALWLASVKFGNHAPIIWRFFWKVVPGATAIRVPQRINLVLNVGMIAVSMYAIDKLATVLKGRRNQAGQVVLGVIFIALAAEQVNSMPTHLISRPTDIQKLFRIERPPQTCSAFYIIEQVNGLYKLLQVQTDAMLIAERVGIPTLNGYSGWSPDGWNLIAPQGRIERNVRDWALQNRLTKGLCSLDAVSGRWSPVNVQALGEPVLRPVEGALVNSGFEGGRLSPWTPFQNVRSQVKSGHARSGTYSLVEMDGEGSVYQDADELTPHDTYWVKGWVLGSAGATATAQIAIWDPAANVATFSRKLRPRVGEWQFLDDSFTLGNGRRLRIHLFRNKGSGSIYWDDIRIYREEEKPRELVNAGFETGSLTWWTIFQSVHPSISTSRVP